MYVSDDLRYYERARRSFSLKTYSMLILWLVLAFVQWVVVCLIEDARTIFRKCFYICLITFAVAVLLFLIFIFVQSLRFLQALNFIVALIIVELMIISTFALVVLSWWAEILTFFAVAAILVFLFLLIGILLPRRMDLTLDIAILFIVAFIFLIITTFILIFELTVRYTIPIGYLVVELSITFTILLFVMYHGQTIHGSRFAEMRLNDYFLASLILFHDFLIIFWLTFYWQIRFRPISADSWVNTSTPYPYYTGDPTSGWEYWNLQEPNAHLEMAPHKGTYKEHEDVTGQIPKDSGKDDYWQTAKPTLRGFPREWFAYKGKDKESGEMDDQFTYKVDRPGIGPMADGVLYKAQPFDDRNAPVPEDESGERYNDEPQMRNGDDGLGIGYGDASGKLEAGNPSIAFPLADHQPKLNPANKESVAKSMLRMVETSPPEQTNPKNEESLGKNHEFGDQLSEQQRIAKESTTKVMEPNLLDDEMKGLEVPEKGQPEKKDEGLSPDWEVLSQDELRKLADSKILKNKVKDLIQPRVRTPYYPKALNSRAHAKPVNKDSSKVLK